MVKRTKNYSQIAKTSCAFGTCSSLKIRSMSILNCLETSLVSFQSPLSSFGSFTPRKLSTISRNNSGGITRLEVMVWVDFRRFDRRLSANDLRNTTIACNPACCTRGAVSMAVYRAVKGYPVQILDHTKSSTLEELIIS